MMRFFFTLHLCGCVILGLCGGCSDDSPSPELSSARASFTSPQIKKQQKSNAPPKGWPFFRGPNGNGIVNQNLDLLPQPQKLWAVDIGSGNASLVIQDGRLYTIGNRGGGRYILCCLNAKTGKTIWERKIETYSFDSSPAVEEGRIYVLCHRSKPAVQCFKTSNGDLVWERELPAPTRERTYGHAGSPLLWKDLVIVNAGLGAALKKSSGEVVWQHRGQPGLATPVLFHENNKACVMIFGGDTLMARDILTGRLLWSIPWKTDIAVNACDPIYSGGKVFISTTYGKHAALFDVTAKPARQLWKERGSAFSSGFLWQDHLYCFAGDEFCCLKYATGARQWQGPSAGRGSAILAGDKIILVSGQGILYVGRLSSEKWHSLMQTRIHGGTTWTPPSLVGGRLYARNNAGQAVCLQIGKEK